MKINLTRDEALACLIVLQKKRKPHYWERQAIQKICKRFGWAKIKGG